MVRQRRMAVTMLAVALVAATAHAANYDEAPPESQEQVQNALRVIAPLLASGRASADGGAKAGTLEEVVRKFAPAKFHPVDEGPVAAPKPNGQCPSEMRLVADRVCVDRWEAHLVEKSATGDTVHSPYESPEAGRVYVAKSAAGAVPQAYVSGAQAQAACTAAGKRLCGAAEWRAACGGRRGHAYPYGKSRSPNVCRDRGVAPMMVYHAEELKRGWGRAELNDPRLNQHPDTVAKTGSYAGCVNDYGLFDMVGNLHEWTADPNGTFQGGYWLDTSQHGDGCAYRTIAHPFDYRDYSIGFRCCKDPT